MKTLNLLNDALYKIKPYILGFLITGNFTSCVEEILLGNPEEVMPELVVEGSINDFDETFRVRLKTTSSILGVGENLLGFGANVRIISATDTVQLHEIKPGIYDTEPGALIVERGKLYYLDLVLSNDQHYQSTHVTLPETIPVADTYVEPTNTSRVDELGVFRRSWAHEIFVELQNATATQYYKIDVTG